MKIKYTVAKKVAKKVVSEVKNEIFERLYRQLKINEGGRDIYKMVKAREENKGS